ILDESAVSEGEETREIIPGNFDANARILIVDDHPVNLLFMRQVLNRLGFKNFDEVTNGREALDLSRAKTYDLILLDCQMPDMDGYETARHIRSGSQSVKPIIIAVTANAMKGAEDQCKEDRKAHV